MHLPLVSIITPAYNAAGFISDAITSVKNQTFNNWELIIVDDCSNDSTVQVINNFLKNDTRIKLFSNHINLGPAASRNFGLTKASGRFICFLDSDDYWLPSKLESQLNFMQLNNISFSYTLYRTFRESTTEPNDLVLLPKSFTYHELLKNTGIACLTVMLDREKYGNVKFPLVKHEDFALWLTLLSQGTVAHGLMNDLARYRIANGSVSSNKFQSITWVWNIYRKNEKLSLLYSFWCLCNYIANALIKRIRAYRFTNSLK